MLSMLKRCLLWDTSTPTVSLVKPKTQQKSSEECKPPSKPSESACASLGSLRSSFLANRLTLDSPGTSAADLAALGMIFACVPGT